MVVVCVFFDCFLCSLVFIFIIFYLKKFQRYKSTYFLKDSYLDELQFGNTLKELERIFEI